jgi:hypothetical protein
LEPFAVTEVMRELPHSVPQLATSPPEALAPVRVMIPVCPPLSRTVMVLPPLAVMETIQALLQVALLQVMPQLALSPPVAVTRMAKSSSERRWRRSPRSGKIHQHLACVPLQSYVPNVRNKA